MKKILLFIVLFFIWVGGVFWNLTKEQWSIMNAISWMDETQRTQFMKMEIPTPDGMSMTTVWEAMAKWYLSDGITWPSTEAALDVAWRIKAWGVWINWWWADDLTSTKFMINVNDISPWVKSQWWNTTQRINWLLWTVIQKMMIALWTLSILIMTIWTWYIVFHNWQDELLSKWKSIFMAWIYAMIVALSSYLLISIVRYILYT